jgi:hypothetical protein
VDFYISNWWRLYLGCFLGGFISEFGSVFHKRGVNVDRYFYGRLVFRV